MRSYISELESGDARRLNILKPFCVGLPLVSIIFFLIYFRQEISFSSNFTFSLSTAAVAGILAATYFYAHRFFNDSFFFFIFAGWFANALYLIPELNGPEPSGPGYFAFRLGAYILSLISSVFMLLALLSPGRKRPPRLTWPVIGVAIAIIGSITAYYFIKALPTGIEKFPNNEHITLAWIIFPGSTLSFSLIWGAGEVIRTRIGSENSGWREELLSATFHLYATLQFVYPFLPYLHERSHTGQNNNLLLVPFLIAQLAKVGNVISMLGVLQAATARRDLHRDKAVRDAQNEMKIREAELMVQEERLQRKREFIELGMLASSIKHDVNTPLATMSFDIETLKNRFQHNPEIVRKLERLEESMERIYAIVKVVDILRGDKAFFDRDQFMAKASMLEIAHRAVRSVKNERSELKLQSSNRQIKVEGREVWVRAYVPMLEQVLVNVIKNGLEAIDEAERAHGLINIRVGTTEIKESNYSRWVRVEVSDNGVGIPEENIDKLTTLFTTRSHKKPNSGIGLFIGKKILDIHNGEIKFESAVGEGTRVTLLMPEWFALQKAEAQQASLGSPESGEKSSPSETPPSGEGGTEAAPQVTQTPRKLGELA
jgi:signal transduction histidine kinase